MTVTKTFGYTGGWQTYVIPAGITSVSVTIDGAGSGSRGGARCTGSFAVSGGQTLYLVVGGQGGTTTTATGAAGGWGAGGAGGTGVSAKGGNGGGGYSAIRIGSTSGTLKGLAGGAGGDSGDAGAGGAGGSGTGGRGNAGSNSITLATGGASNNGGTGGTSSSGSAFNGANGSPLGGSGGHGGNTGGFDGPGGGGGGGGYGSGGGGTAGSSGFAPGGGGGGGGSYIGGLSGAVHTAGGGGAGNGTIVIVHADPNTAPNTPTLLTPGVGEHTLSTGSVDFSATVSDPNNNTVRALFRVSDSSAFSTYTDFYGTTVASGSTSTITATGLALNTHYYVRCYAEDSASVFSSGFDTGDFYTDLVPDAPTSILPAPSTATLSTGTVNVSATVSDPDRGTVRALFRYSTDGFMSYTDIYSNYVASGGTATAVLSGLSIDTLYQVEVYVQDPQGQFSNPVTTSFYTNRTPTAPTLNSPVNNEIFDNTQAKTFSWTFNDPDTIAGDVQSDASLRWRPNGSSTWNVISGIGGTSSYRIAANTFTANVTYEWQVQTVDANGAIGPWSSSNLFSSNPAASGMIAKGGMNILSFDTVPSVSTMVASAAMPILGNRTQFLTLSIPVRANLSSTSFSQVNRGVVISSAAAMNLIQSQTLPYSLHMSGVSIMTLLGSKTVDSVQLSMLAKASMPVQITLGATAISAQTGLTIVPSANLLRPTLSILVSALLTSEATSRWLLKDH
jgi:hypothetical protein